MNLSQRSSAERIRYRGKVREECLNNPLYDGDIGNMDAIKG